MQKKIQQNVHDEAAGEKLLIIHSFTLLKHWHQLDLILIKKVLHTRSYHSADCTDYSLVSCTTKEVSPFQEAGKRNEIKMAL